jgi:hypothetical protein
VAYTPDWEPLADALKRVTATGASEDEAKPDLCRAVADRKIRVRVRIAASDHARGGQVFCGGNFRVPVHLAPGDFDWIQSCPLSPWLIGPRWGEQREPAWARGWENRPLDLIELSTVDVSKVLCGGEIAADNATPATTKRENAAIRDLAVQLKNNPQMARASAMAWLKQVDHNLGKRAFDRVWSRARERAGLSRIAAPGRKPKSSR